MTRDSHQIAHEFFAALSRGDVPDSLLAPDMTFWSTSSGKSSDKARFQFGIRLLASICEGGLIYRIDSLTAEDDRVAAEVQAQGRLINGDEYHNRYAFVLRVRDGRITSVCEYNDPIPIREKLVPLLQDAMAKMQGSQR
jgi:ketosteroid isomerase-like protein